LPYKDKERYKQYMRLYMRRRRREAKKRIQQLQLDRQKIKQLQRMFPEVYELLFGKGKKGKRRARK